MKKKLFSLIVATFLFVISLPIISYAVAVNFDDVPSDTVVNNTYSSQGVTFTSSIGGNVYAWGSILAHSTPNVVTINNSSIGDFSESVGVITATFSCSPTQVTLWALPDDDDDPAFLRAYDSSDNEIDSYTKSASNFEPELMTVTAPAGQSIAYVRFAGLNGETVAFDDLTFTGGICDSHMSVPTMSEWGMIIFMILSGIGALYFMKRQKKFKE
jgi:hypothetical protein